MWTLVITLTIYTFNPSGIPRGIPTDLSNDGYTTYEECVKDGKKQVTLMSQLPIKTHDEVSFKCVSPTFDKKTLR